MLIQINGNIVDMAKDLISLPDGSMGINVIIFGADISSSVHIGNKNEDVLILGEGPTQGLDSTTLTGETK